jgi:hypothetical protein
MKTITSSEHRDWTLFCRPYGSEVTGSRHGECFAQSFYPEHIAEHKNALHKIANLYRQGKLRRCGGWEHYRVMSGARDDELNIHAMRGRFVKIDDWTEDFDYPEDYILWTRRKLMDCILRSNHPWSYILTSLTRVEMLISVFISRCRKVLGKKFGSSKNERNESIELPQDRSSRSSA